MDTQQEYEEWKNDPVAQAEYQQWRIQDELKRSKLPDPFEINGVENEPNRRSKRVNIQTRPGWDAPSTSVPNH